MHRVVERRLPMMKPEATKMRTKERKIPRAKMRKVFHRDFPGAHRYRHRVVGTRQNKGQKYANTLEPLYFRDGEKRFIKYREQTRTLQRSSSMK